WDKRPLWKVRNAYTYTTFCSFAPLGDGVIHDILTIKIIDIRCPHAGSVLSTNNFDEVGPCRKDLTWWANASPVNEVGWSITSNPSRNQVSIELITDVDNRRVCIAS